MDWPFKKYSQWHHSLSLKFFNIALPAQVIFLRQGDTILCKGTKSFKTKPGVI